MWKFAIGRLRGLACKVCPRSPAQDAFAALPSLRAVPSVCCLLDLGLLRLLKFWADIESGLRQRQELPFGTKEVDH